jgi:hypothetical protein
MALLYSAGSNLGSNLLARVPDGHVTCDPAAATDYPIAKAHDGTPWPFVFGAIAADSYVQVRNNLVENPGFEVALGDEWEDVSTPTGSADQTPIGAGRGGAGTYGLRCNGGAAGVGGRLGVIRVRAGETLQLDGWIFTGVAHLGGIYLYNPTTGHYYDGAGGDWQAGAAYAASITGSVAYQQITTTYVTIESMADCLAPEVDIWLTCRTAENADVDFDDISLRTAVNGIGGVGHNICPCVAPTFRYSSDEFVGDDNEAAAITLAQPTWYAYLSAAIYPEWLRLKLGGTNTVAPSIDELWVGLLSSIAGPPAGWRMVPQSTVEVIGSPHLPYRVERAKYRSVRLEFDFTTGAEGEWYDLLTDLEERTERGKHGLVIVPSTLAPHSRFMCGRIDPVEFARQRGGGVWQRPLTIHEMAFSMPLL